MEKLLVTTDFSTNSKAGIRFALQMQSQSNCSLVFYHAISVSKPTSWNDKKYKSFQAEKIDENLKNLEDFVTEIGKQSGFKTLNCEYVAETGTETDEMIIRYAKKIKANFICLSTHGAGRIRKILGTNASELITTSPIPVIVVPKSYKTQAITNVFYASDFSSLDKELKAISAFTVPLHLKVDVFHYDYLLHVPENKAKLEKKAAKHENADLHFHFKRQEIELPLSEHLRKEIKKEKPSMVILFTKQNRNWYDRLFLSSESADMAFNAQVPLLVFRKK